MVYGASKYIVVAVIAPREVPGIIALDAHETCALDGFLTNVLTAHIDPFR